MKRGRQKNWRAVELIVKRLEEILEDGDANFKSPDKLLDYTNSEYREVDISITYPGRHSKVVFFEIRDRKQRGGSQWVEQVYSKQNALRATAIMVHTSGFTQPAIDKAKTYGISLLTLRQVQETDWRHWYPVEAIVFEKVVFYPIEITVRSETRGDYVDFTLPCSQPDIDILVIDKRYSLREFAIKYWALISSRPEFIPEYLRIQSLIKHNDFIQLSVTLPATHFFIEEEIHSLVRAEFFLYKRYIPEKRAPIASELYSYQKVDEGKTEAGMIACTFEVDGDQFQVDFAVIEDEQGNAQYKLGNVVRAG
ncbi:MAG: restriction endonuclease [Anaerolineae bacterium]|nr:restriction endonuclease [Anaerolineae bacterium]